jgi:hypothetical protein
MTCWLLKTFQSFPPFDDKKSEDDGGLSLLLYPPGNGTNPAPPHPFQSDDVPMMLFELSLKSITAWARFAAASHRAGGFLEELLGHPFNRSRFIRNLPLRCHVFLR